MDSSLYAFVADVMGDGTDDAFDRVLDQMLDGRDGLAVGGLTVAAVHHRARDITPHGRSRVTLRHDGAHFLPAPDLFAGLRLSPPVQDDAAREPLARLRAGTAARGAALHGWAVFGHSTTLGMAYPDCATESCFGDRSSPGELCPANPDVREYAVALARNVARTGVDTVVAESLHYGGSSPPYGPERSSVALSAVDRFLLELCFCEHCLERCAEAGADGKAARAECAATLERVFDGGPFGPDDVTEEALERHAGPHTAAYARARRPAVTSLVAEVAAGVADEGSRLYFLDPSGGSAGYGPSGAPAADHAWRLGVDVAEVSRAAHGYIALGYIADTDRVSAEVAAYRAAGADPLRVVLRPGPPDTDSGEHLAAKVAAVRGLVEAVDFANYGLNTLGDLERIGDALRGNPAA